MAQFYVPHLCRYRIFQNFLIDKALQTKIQVDPPTVNPEGRRRGSVYDAALGSPEEEAPHLPPRIAFIRRQGPVRGKHS